MLHIALPDTKDRRLVFYLAMEEYVASNIEAFGGEVFFIWQVKPTVIFGRNQVMEAEVNVPYCKDHGIQLYRRKSGGGCVYADDGNIMISQITATTDSVAFTFDSFMQKLALCLSRLGLKAERSGRNDVTINGKKISGNAFFMTPHAGIVHGTLLYKVDTETMEKAITPSSAKIKSKGVDSVRQRVTDLETELNAIGKPMDIEKVKTHIEDTFCPNDECLILGPKAIAEIEKIEATYLDENFLHGRNHHYTLAKEGRIDGVGEVDVEFDMDADKIESCRLTGDFLSLKESIDDMLTMRLKGRKNDREAAEKALEGLMMEDYVMNLTNKAFLDHIFGKQ